MAVLAVAKKAGLAEARLTAEDHPDPTAAAGRVAGVDTPAALRVAHPLRAVAAACPPHPRTICRSNPTGLNRANEIRLEKQRTPVGNGWGFFVRIYQNGFS